MLSKANVRIDIPIPANADFTLASYTDPIGCATPPSASDIRMYRRPLPASNSAFLATVMWDGRENVNPPNNTVALIQADLAHQANDATLGHAQATAPLSAALQQQIVGFETNLFNAQRMIGSLSLNAGGAKGGGEFLYENTLPSFYIGINDVLGCSIPNSCQPGKTATFTSVVFTVYAGWESKPPNAQAAAIGRGEALFNTRSFAIDNVPGINGPNDTLGLPSPLTGFCGTCHDSPNIGNHSTSLPIDIGIAAANPVGGLDVARLPTYTFRQNGTGNTVTVTDAGRGLISGKFADIGKTKGPNLRALATRAPYFHNGSAKDLNAVVSSTTLASTLASPARRRATWSPSCKRSSGALHRNRRRPRDAQEAAPGSVHFRPARLPLCALGRGKGEIERRADAHFAFYPNPPFMRLDDPLHDLESEASAAAPGFLRLPYAIEDVRHLLGVDPVARVLYPEQHFPIVQRRPGRDSASRLGEFGGVADQVLEHLENAIPIDPDVGKPCSHIDPKIERGRSRERTLSFRRIEDELPSGDAFWFDRKTAAFDSRHVEDVLYEAIHSGGGTLDRLA